MNITVQSILDMYEDDGDYVIVVPGGHKTAKFYGQAKISVTKDVKNKLLEFLSVHKELFFTTEESWRAMYFLCTSKGEELNFLQNIVTKTTKELFGRTLYPTTFRRLMTDQQKFAKSSIDYQNAMLHSTQTAQRHYMQATNSSFHPGMHNYSFYNSLIYIKPFFSIYRST